jgi:hypothetical protein
MSKDLLNFKRSQSEKIKEATFAGKGGPEIFWTSEPLGFTNFGRLVMKQYGRESAIIINLQLLY